LRIAAALLLAIGIAVGAVSSFVRSRQRRAVRNDRHRRQHGGTLSLVGWALAPRGKLSWLDSEPTARAQAETERRPMLLDFTANGAGRATSFHAITFGRSEGDEPKPADSWQ